MDLPQDKEDIAIINAILQMAKSPNLSVVAEGVETADQVFFLRNQGCEIMQGLYFSKPLAAAETTKLLDGGISLDI